MNGYQVNGEWGMEGRLWFLVEWVDPELSVPKKELE